MQRQKLIKRREPITGVCTTRILRTWKEALALRDEYGFARDRWVFRGHRDASWTIASSLERAKAGGGKLAAWRYEGVLLREFSRRAHHYASDVPKPQHVLEWFALMRHYGAPCRLVDFSYSFYIAAYFALQDATPQSGLAAIWAVNTTWLHSVYRRLFPLDAKRLGKNFRFKSPKDFKRTFLSRSAPRMFVAPANPYRLNERVSAQQGVFLAPGSIRKSFMANLIPEGTQRSRDQVVRILLDPAMKTEAIRDLRRMNVTAATLYPDLAGFAISLKDWFHLPLNFDPRDLEMALDGRLPGDHF